MSSPGTPKTATRSGRVRVRIVGGGRPTPAQLAAMVAALPRSDPGRGSPTASWRLAGVLEGVGEHVLEGPDDLRRARALRGR